MAARACLNPSTGPIDSAAVPSGWAAFAGRKYGVQTRGTGRAGARHTENGGAVCPSCLSACPPDYLAQGNCCCSTACSHLCH